MEIMRSVVKRKWVFEGPSSQEGPVHQEDGNNRDNPLYLVGFTSPYTQMSQWGICTSDGTNEWIPLHLYAYFFKTADLLSIYTSI